MEELAKVDFSFKKLFVIDDRKSSFDNYRPRVCAFFNGLFNNFIADDESQILLNSAIHKLSNIPIFFTGSTFYNGGAQLTGIYYKPLMTTSFALLYSLFGPNAFGFHFFQICLYILNACLVFFFMKHFFSKILALFLSVIFLVHPINSEVALYISDTQDVLILFFGMLALLFSLIKQQKSFVFVAFYCLFSLLSKETHLANRCHA